MWNIKYNHINKQQPILKYEIIILICLKYLIVFFKFKFIVHFIKKRFQFERC